MGPGGTLEEELRGQAVSMRPRETSACVRALTSYSSLAMASVGEGENRKRSWAAGYGGRAIQGGRALGTRRA